MPAFDREPYVGLAIGSVLSQTYRDLELVFLDDGSTDRTLAIARERAARDPRVRVIESGKIGLPAALSLLHERARGEYIGWVDSDDLLAKTALAETVAHLDARPEVGMVYTDHHVMREDGQVLGLGRRCKIEYSKERLLVELMTFHFRLFRRHLYDRVGGLDLSNDCAIDYDFCLRMSEVTEIEHLARSLYFYRTHARSISSGRQLDQIECSRRAIEKALVRRGMAEQVELDVEIVGHFTLRKKTPPAAR